MPAGVHCGLGPRFNTGAWPGWVALTVHWVQRSSVWVKVTVNRPYRPAVTRLVVWADEVSVTLTCEWGLK